MKNKKFIGFLLIALLTAPSISLANDDSSGEDSSRDRMEKMSDVRKNHADDWARARNAYKNSRKSEDRPGLRKAMAMLFFDRFHGIGTGLQKLHDRIEAWLNKVDDKIDGATAREALASAQKDLDSVKDKVAQVKTILESEVSEADKPAKREEIKSLLSEIKALTKSAHESLKTAFRSIKEELKVADQNSDQN